MIASAINNNSIPLISPSIVNPFIRHDELNASNSRVKTIRHGYVLAQLASSQSGSLAFDMQ